MLRNNLIVCLIASLFIFFINSKSLAEDSNMEDPLRLTAELNSLLKDTKKDIQSKNELEAIISSLKNIEEKANVCIEQQQTEIEKIQQSINVLGTETTDEKRDVTEARKKLVKQKSVSEAKVSQCKLLAINATQKIEEFNALRQKIVKKSLFHKEDNILKVISDIKNDATQLPSIKQFFLGTVQQDTDPSGMIVIFLIVSFLLGLLCSFILRKFGIRKLLHARQAEIEACEVKRKALQLIRRYLSLIVGFISFTVMHSLWFRVYLPDIFLLNLIYFAIIYIFIRLILISFVFISSFLLSDNHEEMFHICLSRTFDFIGSLLLFYLAIIYTDNSVINPQVLYSISLFLLVAVCSIVVWWFLYISSCFSAIFRFIISLIQFVFYVILIVACIGYFNLSSFFVRSILFSLVLFCNIVVFDILLRATINFIAKASIEDSHKGSQYIALSSKNTSILWFKIGLDIFCLVLFALGILKIWSVTGTAYNATVNFLVNGFSIENFSISPVKVAFGLLIFAAFWNLAGFIKKLLKKRWADEKHIETSAIDALTTLTGYIGFIIAAIAGLSVAGFNFSNLAMIAGALSVGIGFGLQHIVNNFVSGLILLFERPIKKGDWVVVKDVEGIVKRISVRSTIIQTFDKQDVIVPNSEFISGVVKNWVLDDLSGRVRINVGVAYGSDVEKVKTILIDIVSNHPLALTNDSALPPPTAWITNFGDSSVDFQVWFYIKDINKRPSVSSEIRFAIYKAFKENGIEIPFPQRDVHIKN